VAGAIDANFSGTACAAQRESKDMRQQRRRGWARNERCAGRDERRTYLAARGVALLSTLAMRQAPGCCAWNDKRHGRRITHLARSAAALVI